MRFRLLVAGMVSAAIAACSSTRTADDATATASPSPSPSASETPAAPFDLRVMTGNLSSGNGQDWDGGEGRRIVAGAHPDVMLFQEWNLGANGVAETDAWITSTLGPGFTWVRESAQLPNGIASRYPIVDSGNFTDPQVTNRSFEWAHIDLPGPDDLYAVSVHLLTSSATNRDLEAQALVSDIAANFPANAFVIVGGDFNTDVRSEAAITTFSTALVVAPPWPEDQAANGNTNAARAKPYDWVLASPSLDAKKTAVVMSSGNFANGLVIDTRVYTPISDLAPALAGDSGASGMQHMGVVREFHLP